MFIKNVKVVYALDVLQFEWSNSREPTTEYQLSIVCMTVPSGIVYIEEDHSIPGDHIHFLVPSIQASSRCETIFFAVYNPASIDYGIAYTFLITPASKYLEY